MVAYLGADVVNTLLDWLVRGATESPEGDYRIGIVLHKCHAVSRQWSELAADNPRWELLYTTEFGLEESEIELPAPGQPLEPGVWRRLYLCRRFRCLGFGGVYQAELWSKAAGNRFVWFRSPGCGSDGILSALTDSNQAASALSKGRCSIALGLALVLVLRLRVRVRVSAALLYTSPHHSQLPQVLLVASPTSFSESIESNELNWISNATLPSWIGRWVQHLVAAAP